MATRSMFGSTRPVTGAFDVPSLGMERELHRIRGIESLSSAFSYVIEATVDFLDLEAARGQLAHVLLTDGITERHLSGVVDRIDVLAGPTRSARHRIHLIPKPALVRYRYGHHIFQDLSVPDIVKQVFKEAGLGDELFQWSLNGSYPTRTYCVQYDESEWDFVCRLFEEEGIFFFFEHAIDGHVMVITDDNAQATAIEPSSLRFQSADHDLRASVWSWRRTSRVVEGTAAVNDYDLVHPSVSLLAEQASDEPVDREWYEYPAGQRDPADATRLARVRLEELQALREVVAAQTDHFAVSPGRTFEVLDHPDDSGQLLVVECRYDFQLSNESGSAGETGAQAEVLLRAIPLDTPFRPKRTTPKPRIHGVQTAVVSGPSGQEIHCDDQGRVKVQFHWDPHGKNDDKSSCWIRTFQGHTTGSVQIPRIGWEVVVQFYGGSPDRPVVLGRLYNPLFPPDYALPAQKTVTAMKSASSPGANGGNEICLDDTAGSQCITVDTVRDITIVAANNKLASTGNCHRAGVGANRTMKVIGMDTTSVEAGMGHSIGGSHTVDVTANRDVKTNANAVQEVVGDIVLTVSGMENMQVGNPADAVMQIVAAEATKAVSAAAAKGASRAEAALLGPVAPALNAARGALGSAKGLAGTASAILGSNPAGALFGSAAGALGEVAAATNVTKMASGVAAAAMSKALSAAGAGGGGAAAGASGGAGGSGSWTVNVQGNFTEDIGALSAITSAYGVSLGVGGSSIEDIGLARLELIKGGKVESCKSKTETVGIYKVNAKAGINLDAKGGVVSNVASQTQKITGGHALTADGAAALTGASITLEASDKVTLTCGTAEVVVDGNGISIKGALKVVLKGTSEVTLVPCAIGPG